MEILYNKFKGRVVTFPDNISGTVCGYTNDNLLLAVEGSKAVYLFRKFGKESHFISDDFKDSKFKYCYCSEKDAEKSKKKK